MTEHATPETPSRSLPRPWSSTSWRDPAFWLGPAITTATLALTILIRPAVPISSPGIPLLVTIAASAALGGVRAGLLSAAITIVFVALDASLPGRLLSYDASGSSRVVLNVSAAIAMALLVGWIRSRLDVERDRVATQRAAEHQRAFTDTASDAMITIDARGRIRSANPAAGRMFGYDAGSLVNRPVEDLLAPSIREAMVGARRRYLQTGQRQMSWTNTQLTGSRADGSEFPLEVSFGEFADKERYFTWIIRDVSERKALEDQLAQAQKMEAIGQLAGGVAHDFNNMLTAIGGFAELMAEDDEDPAGRRHAIEGIRSAADRAAGLTRQLLAFSRRQHLEPKVLNLNETLSRIEPLLRRLLGEHVKLVVHGSTDLWPVLADPSQLETVVMNLAINGRDAMPDGGTLTIETANAELDEMYASNHLAVEPGSYAMLSVSDTGGGMDPETLTHIFEPFYTTKAIGRGTGLGLSSAYGVVKQSGGNVWVYSEPSKGTTFKVYLPRAEGVITGTPADANELLATGTETVLIAEDEPVVRELILTTLRRYGYVVHAASDGREAISILERDGSAIDLLVSDVVMPNLGGLELLELARARHPGLPVILISGYSEKLLPAGSVGTDVILLEKPFTARQLTDAIRRALTAGDGTGRTAAAGERAARDGAARA